MDGGGQGRREGAGPDPGLTVVEWSQQRCSAPSEPVDKANHGPSLPLK